MIWTVLFSKAQDKWVQRNNFTSETNSNNPDTHPDLQSCVNWYQKTAEQRSADIRAMFRDIEVKFAMKCECSQSYWQTLYDHASSPGCFAIDRNKKAYEAMNAAWDPYESDLRALRIAIEAKKFDEVLKAALSAVSRLDGILLQIDRTRSTPEFDNDSFKMHLDELRKKVQEAPKTDPLKADFQGSNDKDRKTLKFPSIDLKNEKEWKKIRDIAIKKGIILKSKGKGVSKAINSYNKAAGTLTKLKGQEKNTDPNLISGARRAVMASLNSLEAEFNETQEEVKHEKFRVCLEKAADDCRQQSKKIEEELKLSGVP